MFLVGFELANSSVKYTRSQHDIKLIEVAYRRYLQQVFAFSDVASLVTSENASKETKVSTVMPLKQQGQCIYAVLKGKHTR